MRREGDVKGKDPPNNLEGQTVSALKVTRKESMLMKKIVIFILSAVMLSSLMLPAASAASASSRLGRVSTGGSGLNVRSSRSTSAPVLASLPNASPVTLMWQSGAWWYVEYADGRYGYCHGDYISSVTSIPKTVTLSWGTLNVRSGAGMPYARIDSLENGDVVLQTSVANGWSRIVYDGVKTGYVSAKYLRSPQSYPAVYLSVPQYDQGDSRWASIKLGSSGKTMARIGCATTGLAMTESYRTSSTVTPAMMAKRLKYTSSGNLYWPDNYVAVTSSSGYLQMIYELLSAGKPVLIGAKASSGSQHWVVVDGYVGGSTLTASGFTVNDPASASRTTLQELFDTHPIFYKYFYYQ